jgi:hypothetical protein
MLDIKDFSIFETQAGFDFKGFLIKTGSYWKWFLVSLIVTFSIAHQVNVRKQKIFGIGTTIAVKEENNPFFTSNTSLVFNWGGTSDKVQMISTTLKSMRILKTKTDSTPCTLVLELPKMEERASENYSPTQAYTLITMLGTSTLTIPLC